VEKPDADVEPALHPAGEAVDAVLRAIGQIGQDQDLVHPPGEIATAHSLQPTEEDEVLAGSQVGVDRQVLWDIADRRLGLGRPDVHGTAGRHDLAAVAAEQAADHRDRRGLARPVGAQEPVGLAGCDLEADAVDGGPVAVSLAEVTAHQLRLRLGHRSKPRHARRERRLWRAAFQVALRLSRVPGPLPNTVSGATRAEWPPAHGTGGSVADPRVHGRCDARADGYDREVARPPGDLNLALGGWRAAAGPVPGRATDEQLARPG